MSEPSIGTGGETTVTNAAESVLFDQAYNGGPCGGYYIKNLDTIIKLKVRVKGMHIDRTSAGGTDGMAILEPGEERLFAWGDDYNGITQITAKAATAGTISIRGKVQSRR